VVSPRDVPLALTLGPNWDFAWWETIKMERNGPSRFMEHLCGIGASHRTCVTSPVTGTIASTSRLPSPICARLALELDLGEVHDVAEVWINNKKIDSLLMRPIAWMLPVPESRYNHFEIVVTNTSGTDWWAMERPVTSLCDVPASNVLHAVGIDSPVRLQPESESSCRRALCRSVVT